MATAVSKKSKKVSCPRCGSVRVTRQDRRLMAGISLAIALFVAAIGCFIRPLLILAGLFLLYTPYALVAPVSWTCRDCHHSWQSTKAKAGSDHSNQPGGIR